MTTSTETPAAGGKEREGIPHGLRRRLTTAINLAFLATMGIFLAASYDAEKDLYLRIAFAHLDENLGLLAAHSWATDANQRETPGMIEQRLQGAAGVAHRVLFTNDDFGIVQASDPALLGRDVRDVYKLSPYGNRPNRWFIASADGVKWLISSLPLTGSQASGRGRLYLLRTAGQTDTAFAGAFLRVHGLHIIVTLILFTGLLYYLTNRYVRKPIEALATHMSAVETGNFRSPVTEPGSGGNELEWLGRRFTRMGTNLRDTVTKLVRAEKYATLTMVVLRLAHELEEPIRNLERYTASLDRTAEKIPALKEAAAAIREEKTKVVAVIQRLRAIEPPGENTSSAETPR